MCQKHKLQIFQIRHFKLIPENKYMNSEGGRRGQRKRNNKLLIILNALKKSQQIKKENSKSAKK